MMELCNEHRGIQLDYRYDEASGRSTLRYELPLSEIATEFFSKLKSRSVRATSDFQHVRPTHSFDTMQEQGIRFFRLRGRGIHLERLDQAEHAGQLVPRGRSS